MVICPTAALSTLEPALGSAMPAAYEGDVKAILIGSTPAVSKETGQNRLRLVYEMLLAETAPLTIPATWDFVRTVVQRSIEGRTYRVLFEVPDTTTAQNVEAAVPPGTVYPGESSLFAPQFQKYQLSARAQRPDKSVLWLQFEPLPGGQIPEGHGVILFDVGGDVVEIREDEGGNRVWEVFEEGGKFYRHVVAEGPAFRFFPRCDMTLLVKARTPLVTTLMALYGKINASPLPHFGNAPAETMRFGGVRASRPLIPNSLYEMRYRLSFNPKGWNKDTKFQKQQRYSAKEDIVDKATKEPTGEKRTVCWWVDQGEKIDGKGYKAADFSVLEAIVSW